MAPLGDMPGGAASWNQRETSMKTKFSRDLELTPEFNGNKALPAEEQLKYRLTPMELGDFYDVLDKLTMVAGAKAPDGTVDTEKLKIDTEKFDSNSQKQFMMVCQGFLPRYATSIGAPLLAADDTPITIEEIAKYAPFVSLTAEIVTSLLSISTPTEVELGN
jgi:hypothetical protein